MTVRDLETTPRAWLASELGGQSAPACLLTTRRAEVKSARHDAAFTNQQQTSCVVVAIGDRGNYLPALQVAAREAKHSGLAVKLVHGSGVSEAPGADAHQAAALASRGRRLLDAAAGELSKLIDNDVPVYTCNSPLTGVDSLLTDSVTAPLIVLQRTETAGATRSIPGPTMSIVAAQASCPVALAPSGRAGRLSTGLVMRLDDRDPSALFRSPEWAEAGLRRVPLTITHSWDGPFSRTLTSAHLAPSQKEVDQDRAGDLRRLAVIVAALQEAHGANP